VHAARHGERAERERQRDELAIEMLVALGKRNAATAATERRAGKALQEMTNTAGPVNAGGGRVVWPAVQGSSKEGGCARSVRALNKKDVRLVPCRARYTPSCSSANSAAQPDFNHDGHLFRGSRSEHP
jgi:hypothetical protein